jgi:magnesium transporter
MISIYHWNSARRDGEWLEAGALKSRACELCQADVLWIDLENPTEEEERLVFVDFFHIHPLSLEDITRLRREPEAPPHFPKVEEFSDYLFVIVTPLSEKASADTLSPLGRSTQLSAVLTHPMMITHHYEPLSSVAQLRAYLGKHEAQAERGSDYLFHLLLDASVDEYAPVLDRLDDTLDQVEEQVFGKPRPELLTQLLELKRGVIVLRKALIYNREVLARLARGEFALIEPREMAYYRNVYDHLIRFTELIESAREMVSDLMQTHLAAMSNKLNEIMKVLTMISTTVMPMALISGIYGMNFENNVWPNFKESYIGFPLALLLMVLSGLASFAFFRWKKWI